MNIILDQGALLPILAQAQNIAEKKNNSQPLAHVYFEAKDGRLKVLATDLEVSLTAVLPAEVIQEGPALLPAFKFFEVIRELGEGKVHLQTRDNHWLDIEQARFRSKIKGMDPAEYPLFILNTPQEWSSIPVQSLKDLLIKTEYAVGGDAGRVYLSGVFLHSRGKQLISVATDGHRLAYKSYEENHEWPLFQRGVIISKKGVQEIKKLLDTLEPDEDVEMTTDQSQFFIKKPGVVLGIRLIEGNYPNYPALIPKHKLKVLLPKEELQTAIKRVALFSSLKSRAITLELSENRVMIHTMSMELGDAKDELEISYKEKDVKITYNPAYLLDALNHIEGQQVEIQFENGEKPTLIKSPDEDSFFNIVMPMRL
jgi:DNA polymerase-3 subunit beta